jgi:outer membrane lipoprotein SlyB
MNRNFSRAVALTCCAALVAGCATGPTGAAYRPLVDTQGVDMNKFERDLQDCQGFAQQTANAAQGAAAGALAGAALGALLAAAAGGGYNRSASARVGAVSGAVGAGAEAENSQRNVIRRCLAGRGYRVLQ